MPQIIEKKKVSRGERGSQGRKYWPMPVPWLCVAPWRVTCLVMMEKMGEKVPTERRGIQVELGPWAYPDGKGWALEL